MAKSSVRECVAHANETTQNKLDKHSDNMLIKISIEQVRSFPNSMKTIDSYIIMAAHIFENAIIDNNIALIDMPQVQFSSIAQSVQRKMVTN